MPIAGRGWYDRTEIKNLLLREMEAYHPITITLGGSPWSGEKEINNGIAIAEIHPSDIGHDDPLQHRYSDPAKHLRNLLEQEKKYGENNSRRLIAPLVIRGNHYVLVVGDLTPGKETFAYIDPFGNPPSKEIVEVIKSQYPGKEILHSTVVQQENGCDCGPLLVQNARDIIVDGTLSIHQSDPLFSELRSKHADALQRSSVLGDRYFELPSLGESIDRTQFVVDVRKAITFRAAPRKNEEQGFGR